MNSDPFVGRQCHTTVEILIHNTFQLETDNRNRNAAAIVRREDKKGFEGVLFLNDLKWTIRFKKSIQEVHKVGDIIFVKKTIMAT